MGQGIPIVYYGSEQGFSGGSDPGCREALWPTGFDRSGDLYGFIATLGKVRRQQAVWQQGQTQRYADDNFYAFTRGDTFVALTNVGSGGSDVTRTITYHPYKDGTKLCSLVGSGVCVTVRAGSAAPSSVPTTPLLALTVARPLITCSARLRAIRLIPPPQVSGGSFQITLSKGMPDVLAPSPADALSLRGVAASA